MTADRTATGMFALISPLEVKQVEILQKSKNTGYFNTSYNIPPFLGNRFKIDHYRDIVSVET